jgi:glycyl-tRNA synthetase alpha chain
MLMAGFQAYEAECRSLLARRLTLPAYDYCIKSSHLFNLLDARGAISVTERTGYIARVRALARQCAEQYVQDREAMGFPLLARAEQGQARQGVKNRSRSRPSRKRPA